MLILTDAQDVVEKLTPSPTLSLTISHHQELTRFMRLIPTPSISYGDWWGAEARERPERQEGLKQEGLERHLGFKLAFGFKLAIRFKLAHTMHIEASS